MLQSIVKTIDDRRVVYIFLGGFEVSWIGVSTWQQNCHQIVQIQFPVFVTVERADQEITVSLRYCQFIFPKKYN